MLPHEFFHRYANTPISNRMVMLDALEPTTTLETIYKRMKELGDQIRPLVLEQTRLTKIAAKSGLLYSPPPQGDER